MSDQEIVATAETQAETSTLFDELAGLVPEERLTEYYRVIAHTRTLSPNDEMLRILEAMGVLALLTRETWFAFFEVKVLGFSFLLDWLCPECSYFGSNSIGA